MTWLNGKRNADAVVSLQDGRLVFAEPYERNEEFPDFLDYVQKSSSKGKEDTANVKYAQTRTLIYSLL